MTDTTKIKLAADHEHAGVPYAAGDTIAVTEADRLWLADRELIRSPAAARKKSADDAGTDTPNDAQQEG